MKIRTLAIVSGVLAIVGVAALGCSSSTNDAGSTAAAGNCPALGTKACPNGDAVDQKFVDLCTKEKADPKCGTDFTNYLKCLGGAAKCTADGKDDDTGSAAACKSQSDAYGKCKQAALGGDAG